MSKKQKSDAMVRYVVADSNNHILRYENGPAFHLTQTSAEASKLGLETNCSTLKLRVAKMQEVK